VILWVLLGLRVSLCVEGVSHVGRFLRYLIGSVLFGLRR
jgi:hypothetical protein